MNAEVKLCGLRSVLNVTIHSWGQSYVSHLAIYIYIPLGLTWEIKTNKWILNDKDNKFLWILVRSEKLHFKLNWRFEMSKSKMTLKDLPLEGFNILSFKRILIYLVMIHCVSRSNKSQHFKLKFFFSDERQ